MWFLAAFIILLTVVAFIVGMVWVAIDDEVMRALMIAIVCVVIVGWATYYVMKNSPPWAKQPVQLEQAQ